VKQLEYLQAAMFEQIAVQACNVCRRYIHQVNCDVVPDAIPCVDELAALPLDIWVRENGYQKIQPNLAGV
jgi:FdhE protein